MYILYTFVWNNNLAHSVTLQAAGCNLYLKLKCVNCQVCCIRVLNYMSMLSFFFLAVGYYSLCSHSFLGKLLTF